MNKLRDLRTDNDLTQEDLAKMLGLDKTAISRWEIGKSSIPSEYLPKLAQILKVSIDEILGLPPPALYKEPDLTLVWYIRQLPRFNNIELAQVVGACNYVMSKRTDNSLKTDGPAGEISPTPAVSPKNQEGKKSGS